MAKQETMTLLEFQEKFNTEEACEAHLFQIRWLNGFICPKCGHNEYYNLRIINNIKLIDRIDRNG
jgi:hypothetical protein